MKSSLSIWHLLHNVKSRLKISSIFVAFLENVNMNFNFKNSKTILYSLFDEEIDIFSLFWPAESRAA